MVREGVQLLNMNQECNNETSDNSDVEEDETAPLVRICSYLFHFTILSYIVSIIG